MVKRVCKCGKEWFSSASGQPWKCLECGAAIPVEANQTAESKQDDKKRHNNYFTSAPHQARRS